MTNRIVLSIVIPTKNRAYLLEKTLESIERQKVDGDVFEVIIIDNGSMDNTKQTVETHQRKIKNLRYFYDARPGLHVGRNRGLQESRGEFIGYLDDDVILFPEWINTILEAVQDKEVMYVGGSVIPYDISIITKEFRNKYEICKGNFRYIYCISCFWERDITENDRRVHRMPQGVLFGGNSVYRKSILWACRGFHPDGMPNNLLMYRGDGESYVARYMMEHKMKGMYYAQASVYHMIDVNRVNDSYINYMFFRNGISCMYTVLRRSKGMGAMKHLKNEFLHAIQTRKVNPILQGELYLLLYYIFYSQVRKWVHKKDYF